MDKSIQLGFAVLELSKLHMYETYYDKLQPYFRQEYIQLHYMDTDSFILSVFTKDNVKDLKNLEDSLDFSTLNENHELVNHKNKKVIGKFKTETPKNIWIEEFVCLKSKMYWFKCGDDIMKNLEGFPEPQPKHKKFEGCKMKLGGKEHERVCNNFLLRSINHEMYHREVKKTDII